MSDLYQIPLPKWIRLKKFSELTGVTEVAFHGKIKKIQVIEGVHYTIAPDGKVMVNWREMDNWTESEFKKASTGY